MSTEFNIAEIGLAKRLGVDRSLLRELRKNRLEKARHWDQLGRNVMYSEKGAVVAAEIIAGPLTPADTSEFEKLATDEMVNEKKPATVRLTCIRARFANPKIIQCRTPDGELVFVTVRSSRNYLPQNYNLRFNNPTPLDAYKSASGQWVKVGRDPRFPGRY